MYTEGRSISGIESKKIPFRKLEDGVDFEITETNPHVSTDMNPADFVYFCDPVLGDVDIKVEAPHWRAISIPLSAENTIHLDNDSFYEIGVKGVGYLKPQLKEDSEEGAATFYTKKDNTDMSIFRYKMMGLMGKRELRTPAGYEHLIKDSNYYHSLGIRTEVYWAFVKLNHIPMNGQMKTIEELREEGVIPKNRNQDPYIAVRLLKNNHRIEQFKKGEHGEELLQHAFDVHNRENDDNIDIHNYEDRNKFIHVLISYLLNNLHILFKNKLAHTGLHSSNITLSGEIVDVGTVCDLNLIAPEDVDFYNKKINGVERANVKDIRDVLLAIRYVLNGFKSLNLKLEKREDLYKYICEYIDSISDNVNYNQVIKAISKVIFVDRESLPMMKTNEYDEQIIGIINNHKNNI